MIDQLTIGALSSYDDFEASLKERKINAPKKKIIKETVPYSNLVYDFSSIDGEAYWNERTLEYTFEITAKTPLELEEKKRPFLEWIMNIANADIYDPHIEDFHFVGTFEDISIDDSEIEKATITVTFSAYPYMIANTKRTGIYSITSVEKVVHITTNSSHRVTPTFYCDIDYSVEVGDAKYSVTAGELTDDNIKLSQGINAIKVASIGGTGILKIEFLEEVF